MISRVQNILIFAVLIIMTIIIEERGRAIQNHPPFKWDCPGRDPGRQFSRGRVSLGLQQKNLLYVSLEGSTQNAHQMGVV